MTSTTYVREVTKRVPIFTEVMVSEESMNCGDMGLKDELLFKG